MNPALPHAEAVATVGERIVAVGSNSDVSSLARVGTEVIDCRGLPLIPGLNDAHCHLLATASALSRLDCSPPQAESIEQFLELIRIEARHSSPGQWIRGNGLQPDALVEARYPTRHELDAVAPFNPVRVDHASGHALVLNSRALQAAGITSATVDPVDGVIDRDSATGEPTGLLLDMGGWLRQRLGNTRPPGELLEDMGRLGQVLLSCGITSVQDAGATNDRARWDFFCKLTQQDGFGPRITMMAGSGKVREFLESGLTWGSGDDWLRLGHAKIMLTSTTGGLQPALGDLEELASATLAQGFPFAIHCVEEEAVSAVVSMPQTRQRPVRPTAGAGRRGVPPARNRIEHCSECPPDLMRKLARSGAFVVTQPGFIYWRGDGYLARTPEHLLPHLYDVANLMGLGIPVAFSSDAPVIDPSPLPGLYSAVTRMTKGGKRLPSPFVDDGEVSRGETCPSDRDGISIRQALASYTLAGAEAEGMAGSKGTISVGSLADLALLDRPLDDRSVERLLEARSLLTVVGGKILWRNGP